MQQGGLFKSANWNGTFNSDTGKITGHGSQGWAQDYFGNLDVVNMHATNGYFEGELHTNHGIELAQNYILNSDMTHKALLDVLQPLIKMDGETGRRRVVYGVVKAQFFTDTEGTTATATLHLVSIRKGSVNNAWWYLEGIDTATNKWRTLLLNSTVTNKTVYKNTDYEGYYSQFNF